MSWCKPALATRYIYFSSLVVFFFSGAVLGATVYIILDQSHAAKTLINEGAIIVPAMGALAAAAILASFAGCVGTKMHNFGFLAFYVTIVLFVQVGQGINSLFLLSYIGSEYNSLREDDTIDLEQQLRELAMLTTLSVANLITAGFQFYLAFFVAVIMYTDSTTVYKADYL